MAKSQVEASERVAPTSRDKSAPRPSGRPSPAKKPAIAVGEPERDDKRSPGSARRTADTPAKKPAASSVGAGRPRKAPNTESAVSAESSATMTASATIDTLEHGLYALDIGEVSMPVGVQGDLSLPLIRVSAFPDEVGAKVELMGVSGIGESWFDGAGGVVLARSPRHGGRVMVTVFGPPDQPPPPPSVRIRRLDGGAEAEGETQPDPPSMPLRAPPPVVPNGDVATEILAHIERLGDRSLPGAGWIGEVGSRRRIEGFGIRPLDRVNPRDIHYKAVFLAGVETAWTGGPQYCGTRGEGQPLLGFAIRIAPHLQSRFSVVYQGAFFDGGISGPSRDGELCQSQRGNDPLEAISVRIVDRDPV